MGRKDTWTGEHHWIPRRGQWAKAYPRLWNELYADYTTHLEHDEHVQVQRDTEEFGPIGAMNLIQLRKLARRKDDKIL